MHRQNELLASENPIPQVIGSEIPYISNPDLELNIFVAEPFTLLSPKRVYSKSEGVRTSSALDKDASDNAALPPLRT